MRPAGHINQMAVPGHACSVDTICNSNSVEVKYLRIARSWMGERAQMGLDGLQRGPGGC